MDADHLTASASNHLFETLLLVSYVGLAPFAALRHQQLLVKLGLVFSTSFCKVGN